MQHPRLALVLSASLFAGGSGLSACSPDAGGGPGASASGGNSGAGGSGGNAGTAGSGGKGGGGGASATGGTTGSAGAGGSGTPAGTGGSGNPGAGGTTGGGTGGSGGGGGSAAGSDAAAPDAAANDGAALAKFSFFYTSLEGMRRLSKSQSGFGGDLRFGEATGLAGADKICQTLAADEGFGAKSWRAFLSVMKGTDGMPVHAIDRIGNGPWYDRLGRLIAMDKAGLTAGNRPAGDGAAVNDLADEKGVGRPKTGPNDTHDVITGTNLMGKLRGTKAGDTCEDWTSTTARGNVGMGHAWPAGSGMSWMQVHYEATCAAGVNLVQNGPGNGSSIGAGGGWGGIYCFALTP